MDIPYILPPLSMVKVEGAAESYGDEPTRERELQGRFKRRILREIQKYDKNKKKLRFNFPAQTPIAFVHHQTDSRKWENELTMGLP